MMAQCPKCNSNKIMERVGLGVLEQETGLAAVTWGKKKGGFLNLPELVRGSVKASICADCGYTELYTDNLAELYKNYLDGKS